MSDLPPLIVVLGPTATGKSRLAIHLARHVGGEILACDSTQVYRHFDIGTAKVPPAEQHGIPHHLTDLVEPDQVFTAGEYRARALGALADVSGPGKVPILTAGTGLYLRALLLGLADAPTRSEELRERLREKIRAHGAEKLHRMLAKLDREAAAKIAPQDAQKVIRAIEMRVLAGKPIGEIHAGGRQPLQGYRVTKIGLAPRRPELYERINSRVNAMLSAGWLDEVRKLVAAGVPADAKPFQFIGYSQLRACVLGEAKLEEAVAQIQQSTRQFAKRQITWFRKEPHVHWLEGFGDDPRVVSAAIGLANDSSA